MVLGTKVSQDSVLQDRLSVYNTPWMWSIDWSTACKRAPLSIQLEDEPWENSRLDSYNECDALHTYSWGGGLDDCLSCLLLYIMEISLMCRC